MERLTAKLDGKGVIMLPSGAEHDWCIGARKVGDVTIQYLSGTAADRLATYEDTGLSPEDIDALRAREQGLVELLARVSCGCAVTYDRLRELAEADQTGRLVVLPCKVGDTVYRVASICTWPEAECPDDSHSCSGCRELRFEVVREKIENVGEAFIAVQYWGRTIFATRQEAEAAVEGDATQ